MKIEKPFPGWKNEFGLKHLIDWVDKMTDGYNAHEDDIFELQEKATGAVINMTAFQEKLIDLTKRVTAVEPKAFPDSAENAKGTEPIEPITGHWVCQKCGKDWGDGQGIYLNPIEFKWRVESQPWWCTGGCGERAVRWVPYPAPSEIDLLRQRLETVEAELIEAYETREKLRDENDQLREDWQDDIKVWGA